MQTFITSLIIAAAALYTANRWLPFRIKQRLLQLIGKQKPTIPIHNGSNASAGDCGSCSSCGNCGSGSTKIIKK